MRRADVSVSLMQIPETFCILPWINLSTRSNGDMQLCCSANSSLAFLPDRAGIGNLRGEQNASINLSRDSVASGWNSETMKSVRRQFLAGEKPAACTKCWVDESRGYRSKRQWEEKYWQSRVDFADRVSRTQPDGSAPLEIEYLDIKLGNKCNLKCVTCSPHDSSAWAPDWRRLQESAGAALRDSRGWEPANYEWYSGNPNFWREIKTQLVHLKKIYVIGGEPTLIKEYYNLLRLCIDAGAAHHIELQQNTNGLQLNEELISLWSQFKKVTVSVSVDGLGAENDYLRFPSRWERLEKNLRAFDQLPANVVVNLDCTVSLMNAFTLPKLLRWKLAQEYDKIEKSTDSSGLLGLHLLYLPRFLSLCALPAAAKAELTREYEQLFSELQREFGADHRFFRNANGVPKWRGMLAHMNANDWSGQLPLAREYLNQMDAIRGTSFASVFPGAARWIGLREEMTPALTAEASRES